MYSLLDRVLKYIMRRGSLIVTDSSGKEHVYGDGTREPLRLKLNTSAAASRIALDFNRNFGEEYMAGGWQAEPGKLTELISLLMENAELAPLPKIANTLYKLRVAKRRFDQYNPMGKAQANVAHHYDLSGRLYDLFLDADRQYSCAYFEKPDATLEEAQLAKKRHIAAKLDIKPGMKVLDIGSGWGGLGLYLADICGADVTGVTLSEEQHKLSNERAANRGLAERARFKLQDYRLLTEKFDRIVSVGMFEHVGVGHYEEFFSKCRLLLADNGVALLHSINRSDGPGATNPWIKKYIFPGGYVPALSEVLPYMERQKLYITDIEILRLHYAKTLNEWGRRFAANREVAKALYDERFCRMWEFYLSASESTFLFGGMNNFQIQFVKNQHVLPLTRDYIAAEEARLRKEERKRPVFQAIAAE